jgi:uncharacterized membrane protein YdbT with pleckstrin-like domain
MSASIIFIKNPILVLIICLSISLLLIAVVFIYLPLYFSSLRYIADDTEIKKISGVFFKTSQSIKYSSIQYSTVVSSVFSKLIGFNFIIFYVYGGRIVLLFLKSNDMDEILKNSGCLYGEGE